MFLNYIKYEYWIKKHDITKPKTYVETKYINGIRETKKIFNDGPIIPPYLTDKYKPYKEYKPKYN